jgi:purine-binding chemotaxis protein CheW
VTAGGKAVEQQARTPVPQEARRENGAAQGELGLSQAQAMLVFDVAGQRYGLAVPNVVQIIEMVAITRLPKAPQIVEGIIDFHGRIIPVVSLRRRFLKPQRAPTLRTPIIIAQLEERTAGLVVDTVHNVVDLLPGQVVGPDQIFLEKMIPQVEHLAGVARLSDGLVLLLDPPTLLTAEEASMVEVAVKEEAKPAKRRRRSKKG